MHLVEVAELPEEDQQLLVELDLLGRSRQISLNQRVVEQPSQTFKDEAQVLISKQREDTLRNTRQYHPVPADWCFRVPPLYVSWRDNSQTGCQVHLAAEQITISFFNHKLKKNTIVHS